MDLFTAVPKDRRPGRLSEYRSYLEDRDGDVNIENRTLSRREESIQRFEARPAKCRELDKVEFLRQYASFDERAKPSPEMLLLLALVKVNAAEAYGVNRTFRKALDKALQSDDDIEVRILCEETYHTRILLSSANRYGIELRDPYRPPSALKALIGSIGIAPELVARPLTLAGEIVGTLLFRKLLEVTERVLADDPETRDAFLERLTEICIDERGHISYNRLQMGSFELAQTRIILPMTARILRSVLPETVALGAYPDDIMQALPLLTDPRLQRSDLDRRSFVA